MEEITSIKNITLGETKGTLLALKFESRRTPSCSLYYVFCYCSKYNRLGWIKAKTWRKNPNPTGISFPYRPYFDCATPEDFISQFPRVNGTRYDTAHIPGVGPMQYHDLIWRAYHNWDEIPENHTVDHIDRDTKNNNISNLRLATQSEQNFNREQRKGNTGHKGIHLTKDGFYEVRHKNKYKGIRKTLKEALEFQKTFIS